MSEPASDIRYSAATGGFYHVGVHAEIPPDAVAVPADRHAQLMRAQQEGARIAPGRGGRPTSVGAEQLPLDELRSAAIARVDASARARILAIASLEQQSNDNAALAVAALVGALSEEASAALARRGRIDAVRECAARAKLLVEGREAAWLASFVAEEPELWAVGA